MVTIFHTSIGVASAKGKTGFNGQALDPVILYKRNVGKEMWEKKKDGRKVYLR